MNNRGLKFLLPATVCLVMSAMISTVGASAATRTVTFEEMLPFTEMLNEVSKRRRLTVYQPNRQSLYDGVPVGFVNAGRGNLSFFRNDLIEPARIPIVIRRVFDSDLRGSKDFGTGGWHLSLAESIRRLGNNDYEYIDGSAARHKLTRHNDTLATVHLQPGDHTSMRFVSATRIVIRYRDGLAKEFVAESSAEIFVLRKVTNKHGDIVTLDYDRQGFLQAVRSGTGQTITRTVTLRRDADGRMTEITGSGGRSVHYDYEAGRLTRVTDAGGHVWSYEYTDTNRLSQAWSPGGDIDLEVTYLDSGKVQSVSHNSSPVEFRYLPAAEIAGIRNETQVTRENGQVYRFGQDSSGRTAFVENPYGRRHQLVFNEQGLVRNVTRDGLPLYEISYNGAGLPKEIRERQDGNLLLRHFEYDQNGDLQRIKDSQMGNRVVVNDTAAGRVIERLDQGVQLELDSRGNLVTVSSAGGSRAEIDYDASGNPLMLSVDENTAVNLEYNSNGRLKRLTMADGEALVFSYDALGLRRVSAGATGSIRYAYSPSGNLISTEVSDANGKKHSLTAYTVDEYEQLTRIDLDQSRYIFDYDDGGALQAVVAGPRNLRFSYDVLGRFTGVSTGDEESWAYSYREAEPGIRLQADQLSNSSIVGARVNANGFASSHRISRSRPQSSSHGIVNLDADLGAIMLSPDFGIDIPGAMQLQGLLKTRLVRIDGQRMFDLTSAYDKKRFNAPSNILFLPPELASLNCIFCPGLQPHVIPITPSRDASTRDTSTRDISIGDASSGDGSSGDRAAADEMALLEISQQLTAVCDYGLPGDPNDPTSCSLTLSGVPQYMCLGRSANVNVTSSSDISLATVTWSSNGVLDFLPYSFSRVGPSVIIEAVSSGNAFISADYLSLQRICQDSDGFTVFENEVNNYGAVNNPATCPQRQQNADLSHEIDGCSIPGITGALLGMHSQQDPVGGMPPNAVLPTTFGQPEPPPIFSAGELQYPLPCNLHDVCYQSCGATRLGCDDQMQGNMLAVCNTAYPSCPFTTAGACADWTDDKDHCVSMSNAIYQGLRLFGELAYRNRQVEYCDCCPPS